VAEAGAPLLTDLNTPVGRAALGVRDEQALSGMTHAWGFRLRPGDATSCLNLYQSQSPRVLGATPEFIARGGFTFQASLAESAAERQNPWRLLEKPLTDGTIPVIGDEAAVKWQLHLGLGKELVVTDEAGRPQRLRFVALLSGSVLQGEVVVSQAHFQRLFPTQDGYAFFLVEAPKERSAEVIAGLERELEAYALDAEHSDERLAQLFAVQNTYLSTFQLLGGLGLLLGAGGLAAVMLRNIYERRKELALLRAVGYSPADLRRLLFRENAVLVLAGLVLGAAPALLAVLPRLQTRPQSGAWASAALLLLGVAVGGLAAGWFALRGLRKATLATALRSE
jgi:ABC-type lipoprotein release transport system permease subunit